MKALFRALLFLPILIVAEQQEGAKIEYVEFVKRIGIDGRIECIEIPRDEAYIRQWQENAANLDLHIIKETIGRRNMNGELLLGTEATGLDIILRGTAQLEANPAAKQAFINAASAWETRLKNPVTITMDVDYGTTRFGTAWGTGVLGSASTAVVTLTVTMRQFADSLKSRNPYYSHVYNNIPDTLYNTTTVVSPNPSGTLANLQALGFRNATENLPFGQAPSIGFNSNFAFDLDPSNGITSGQTDFDAVAVHEMGHALGFVSAVGVTGSARTWDLFRFRPGVVKDTNTFRTSQRVLTPGPNPTGGDHVFWDGNIEWETSTDNGSRNGGGDQQQASHWRDDALRSSVPLAERKIGIMDPNLASGVRDTMTVADLKALAIMGWQIDLPKIIYEPLNFKVFSNYTTPKAITFWWKNPKKYFDGSTVGNSDLKTAVLRDNIAIKIFDPAVPYEDIVFEDTTVTQYTKYNYRIVNVSKSTNDTGRNARASLFAGGSATPTKGSLLSFSNNGSVVVLRIKAPAVHDDNTPLHNLNRAIFFRTTGGIQSPIDSINLSAVDTGKIVYFTDIPRTKVNSYNVGFLGDAPFRAFGPITGTASLPVGKVSTTSYSEGFEVSRTSVVSPYRWDSTNVAAKSGTYSLGALNYPHNDNLIAYLPAVKGNGNPMLRFWTVCRTEGGKDFGKVEVSKNRGANWTEVLSLDENSHPEWAAGNNVWFKKEVNLSAYATDTIFVRFRLTSDGANSKFGWLIDDIELQPLATSVDGEIASVPAEYELSQNFPNPFNPVTKINYAIKERGLATLKVYDVLGKEVQTLINSQHDAGWYAIDFNGTNLSSGIYFYQLRSGNFVETKKLLLMK